MRLLNQMLNLSRIFDCNSVADSAKSYLIETVDSDVASQSSYLSN